MDAGLLEGKGHVKGKNAPVLGYNYRELLISVIG